jgi:predicted metal-dependent HD superfamily phosphohydrolase
MDIKLLTDIYTQSYRHYHNLNHIEVMLEDLMHLNGGFITNAQYYATWFHDVVFMPGAPDNELKSAYFFRCSSSLDDDLTAKVDRMILATAHHLKDQEVNTETAVFLDADMVGMGKSWEIYQRNELLIRAEYSALPFRSYLKSRITFLKALQAREFLFYTEKARELYEEIARNNMEEELEQYSGFRL